MADGKTSHHMTLGHLFLGLSVLVLLFVGPLWERLGVGVLVLWVLLAGVGMYFFLSDRSEEPPGPPN
ncbi:hypothetical protein ACN2MM_10930 [Alkalilimnicola ehrlichii MLHE-1]|uniref:Uncharacterized protein n=1 Tax=Alkalilimnicola ehrlichii (strain ATCC BAA-1101 / DSM 17681 / MLHE-1) TaxID=187272 RepID=Q0A709_ALKEH|nr:hypothetical protein [Alkalilimnicola ehrlichii]ABI57378.1 hypothetical protein Mlg_2036 [Alkalilimnicola ehrlichii MLHE-1]